MGAEQPASDGGVRDALAAQRTSLAESRTLQANERTYLAWVRTALGLLATSLGVLHFFAERGRTWRAFGSGMAAAAGALMVGSYVAYRAAAERIRAGGSPASSRLPATLAAVVVGAAVVVAVLGAKLA